MDPNRPLAKAAMDLDWTTVVALFPEANLDGYDAARIWVLASVLILVEISGLSESEVLSRWPENPYWQAFSGFEQFQWKAPVTHADCLAFRRYVDAQRAARLSAIAQSILQSKPVEATALETGAFPTGPTVDDALALRQVHFLQPQPSPPYKAPPRADLQKGIKQAYAKAAPSINATEKSASDPKNQEPATAAGSEPAEGAKTAGADVGAATTIQTALIEETPLAPIPEKPVVPQFAQTYTMLVKKSAPLGIRPQPSSLDGLVSPEPQLPKLPIATAFAAHLGAPGPTPPVQPPPTLSASVSAAPATTPVPPLGTPAGTPQFDTTAPCMLRALPEEPVTMEVVATGEAPLKYQWETFDDAKGTATPIEGCNAPALTVALEASDTMLAFQCRVSNRPCPQGVVSRTFFLKKAARPSSFGQSPSPLPSKATGQPQTTR